MNSRFDEAVEQILKEYVVEEGILGSIGTGLGNMVKQPWRAAGNAVDNAKSAVNNAAKKFEDNPWGTIGSGLKTGWNVAKGVGRLVSPIASTALGLTPTGLRTGVGAVMNAPRGIANVYQGKKWGDEPMPSDTKSTSSPTSPGSTPLNSLNIPRPALATLARTFGDTDVQQAAVKTSLEAMFPSRGSSGYVSSVPFANVWTAVTAAADKTQPSAHYKDLITNSSLKSRFIANLSSELRIASIDNRDAAKLAISVPAFFMTVPSTMSNDQVNTKIASLG